MKSEENVRGGDGERRRGSEGYEALRRQVDVLSSHLTPLSTSQTLFP